MDERSGVSVPRLLHSPSTIESGRLLASPSRPPPAAGADAGASLIKLALRDEHGDLALECFSAAAPERVAERIQLRAAGSVALTGCGAERLAGLIEGAARVKEFDAWARGARLRAATSGDTKPFLIASLGTGTSVLLVTPEGAQRVGGTALGGGTLLGLGAALLGTRDFDTIAGLAARGDHSRVDLTVGDIYGDDFALPAIFTAASLGKLEPGSPAEPADLAQGIMAMIGENVGRTCALLAEQHGAGRVLFAGGCLRGNEFLGSLLRGMCLVAGIDAEVLHDGEYTGALGALRAAESATFEKSSGSSGG
jgi:type II pantothenate kinase